MKNFLVYKGNDIENAKSAHSFAEIVVLINLIDGPMSFKHVLNTETNEEYTAFDILMYNESYKDAKETIRAIETIFD